MLRNPFPSKFMFHEKNVRQLHLVFDSKVVEGQECNPREHWIWSLTAEQDLRTRIRREWELEVSENIVKHDETIWNMWVDIWVDIWWHRKPDPPEAWRPENGPWPAAACDPWPSRNAAAPAPSPPRDPPQPCLPALDDLVKAGRACKWP